MRGTTSAFEELHSLTMEFRNVLKDLAQHLRHGRLIGYFVVPGQKRHTLSQAFVSVQDGLKDICRIAGSLDSEVSYSITIVASEFNWQTTSKRNLIGPFAHDHRSVILL
jgi:hypothetical protein